MKRLIPLFLLVTVSPIPVAAQADVAEAPINSHATGYGDGWRCDRGFRKINRSCVVVQVPTNAHLDSSGDGWECCSRSQR